MYYLILSINFIFLIFIIINICIYYYKKNKCYDSVEKIIKSKYAIVPGAKIFKDRPCNKLEDRLISAIELYNSKKIDKIIVSGGMDKELNIHESDFMKNYLIKKGIKPNDIIKDYYGINTYSTMYRISKYIQNSQNKQNKQNLVVICTQKMYSGRSLYLAIKLKLNAICYISDKRTYKKKITSETREFLSRIKAFVNCNIYKKKTLKLEKIDFKL